MPDMKRALREMVRVSTLMEEHQAGISALERLIDLDPRDARNWKELGLLLFRAGDTERAEESLNQSITLDAKYAEAYYHLGFLKTQNVRTVRLQPVEHLRQPDPQGIDVPGGDFHLIFVS